MTNGCKMPESAAAIWCGREVKNQTALFRTAFEVPAGTALMTVLAGADSDFILYLDGMEISRGQYPSYPGTRVLNSLEIPLPEAGRHRLAAIAWHSGENFHTGIAMAAGFSAAVFCDGRAVRFTGDGAWRALEHPGWENGRLEKRTVQLTFTTGFDARKFPEDWMRPEFDDSAWPEAAPSAETEIKYLPRPVPVCELGMPVRGEICDCGTIAAAASDSPALRISRAERFHTLEMPGDSGGDDGIFAIFDLGCEQVGFIFFELTAPAGTRVDYGHGEHLEDGCVRAELGYRRFADEYICKEGLNRHELIFHRIGGRYIELHITTPEKGMPVKVSACGIRPWEYPLPEAACFKSSDRLGLELRKYGVRTLELCMHEHYEDCPWREQSMYAYDSRNQALYGYYLWGNYEFTRASFQLLADSHDRRRDGLLSLCAPMDIPITIPVFSLAWVTAAWENCLYSGDASLFERNRGMVRKLMERLAADWDGASGLYRVPEGADVWNFYEWSPLLDKVGDDAGFHALYNCYLLEAARCFVALLGECPEADNWRRRCDALAAAIVKNFYDPEDGTFADFSGAHSGPGDRHEHTQFIALALGLLDAPEAEKVFNSVASGRLHYATLSSMPYLVNSMRELSPAARSFMADKIRSTYSSMLEKGATSLWETQTGAADFEGAGSLCHGWSSLPIYYQGSMLLGVTPLAPGFKKFLVKPCADRYTGCVSGAVPTPAGEITVSWQKRSGGIDLRVSAPAGLECTVASYPECPVAKAVVNGVKIL